MKVRSIRSHRIWGKVIDWTTYVTPIPFDSPLFILYLNAALNPKPYNAGLSEDGAGGEEEGLLPGGYGESGHAVDQTLKGRV